MAQLHDCSVWKLTKENCIMLYSYDCKPNCVATCMYQLHDMAFHIALCAVCVLITLQYLKRLIFLFFKYIHSVYPSGWPCRVLKYSIVLHYYTTLHYHGILLLALYKLANPAQVYLTHPTLVAQWSCWPSLQNSQLNSCKCQCLPKWCCGGSECSPVSCCPPGL